MVVAQTFELHWMDRFGRNTLESVAAVVSGFVHGLGSFVVTTDVGVLVLHVPVRVLGPRLEPEPDAVQMH